MEGILNILANSGIELNEEVKSKITKSLASEYKTIAEYSKIKKKLEDTNSMLSDSNKKLESKSTLEKDLEKLRGENSKLHKLYEDSKNNEYKFDVLKTGVNEKFVDFVTTDILKNKTDEQDFKELLNSYIEDNPQYLNNNFMKVSTTPQSNNPSDISSSSDMINKLIRGG